MSVTCQVCQSSGSMLRVLSLGYMPPPNEMHTFGTDPRPQIWLPTELWFCSACELAQLGYVPDKTVAFPEDYPYTSGATPELRRNFEDLAEQCIKKVDLQKNDLVIDIGSNDGTLLSCFTGYRSLLGIEPTSAGAIAIENGIKTERAFFTSEVAHRLRHICGQAKLITCTNCFAHMPDIHDVLEGICSLLAPGGMFVSESHYLVDLIDKMQYDTIYAEHLRYYTIRSLMKLLAPHGLRVVDVQRIPTHGGSIRVFAQKLIDATSHFDLFNNELGGSSFRKLRRFGEHVQESKLVLLSYLNSLKRSGTRIAGIGAPSRASTVISYCGLDSSIIEYIAEQPHSRKLNRFMPGTDIPVIDEDRFFTNPPDVAVLFSWHLADTIIPKLRSKGYHGEIILPCSVTIVNEPAEVA